MIIKDLKNVEINRSIVIKQKKRINPSFVKPKTFQLFVSKKLCRNKNTIFSVTGGRSHSMSAKKLETGSKYCLMCLICCLVFRLLLCSVIWASANRETSQNFTSLSALTDARMVPEWSETGFCEAASSVDLLLNQSFDIANFFRLSLNR